MTLREQIEAHGQLDIIDEASTEVSLAVFDRRTCLAVSVDNEKQLQDLIEGGAENYLRGPHNRIK